ncbi:MAG: polysaccharide biosynthesis tyrosine autokinase [Cyanobacteria bacterium P01_G01_bin.19]
MNTKIDSSEYIDLEKYWLVLKRRWIPGTATFIAVATLAYIYSLRLPMTYHTKAELLIERDRSPNLTGLGSDNDKINKNNKLGINSDPLATEAQIFSSRPIIQKLIQELNLRNENGELLKYGAIKRDLEVENITGTDLLEIGFTSEDPEMAAAVVNKAIELYKENNTLRHRVQARAAKEFIAKQLPKVENNVARAESNLRRFKNENRIISLSQETTIAVNSISNVESEIDRVEAELSNVNARFNKLENQLGINWQQASALSSLSQSPAVQRSLGELQRIKVELAQKRDYLSNNAPQLVSLKEKESSLTDLLNEQIAETLGNREQNLIENINILSLGELKQQQIFEYTNLGLSKNGLEEQLKTLGNTYDEYKQKSDILPELYEKQRELERRVQGAQSTYQTLLSKLQETEISEQQNIGNVQVVESAIVPGGPSSESRRLEKLVQTGGIVLGAFFGIITAFTIDIWDKKLKNSQEVEAMLDYPIHGIIPDFTKASVVKKLQPAENLPLKSSRVAPETLTIMSSIPLLTMMSSMPLLKEACHSVQIKLKLLNNNAEQKAIAVTSSIASEGKSFVSANLAIAKAQSNHRTLLIDADLRRPTQHDMWEISNNIGLSDVLQGSVPKSKAIRNVIPNLDILPSGSQTDCPVSLLSLPAMSTLINYLSTIYDCIVFDTPPIISLADTMILSKLVDGFLFVVRPGVVDYDSLSSAKKLLANSDLKVLGIVINGVDADREVSWKGYDYCMPNVN